MTTTDDAPALFDTPAPAATVARPRGKHPATGQSPDGGDGAPAAATEPPLDPSRWVMTGWRDAKGVTLTRGQIATVLNIPQGPCARCGTPHHRYGAGGQPLCATCRTEHRPA